jgi:hypothetical protein
MEPPRIAGDARRAGRRGTERVALYAIYSVLRRQRMALMEASIAAELSTVNA